MSEQITTADFQEKVLNSSVPVLVDFFATWCGPCKMMAPVLDELSAELGETGAIYKVDVDRELELAQRYNIMSVPTLIFFKNGEVVSQMVGLQPKAALKNLFA